MVMEEEKKQRLKRERGKKTLELHKHYIYQDIYMCRVSDVRVRRFQALRNTIRRK